MKIVDKVEPLKELLHAPGQDAGIGFVPTMGALHSGHLSLIDKSRSQNRITVCSIFVNPAQFNDPEDLRNYPRPIEEDIRKLQGAGCDVLFAPGVDDIYPRNLDVSVLPDIGILDKVFEATHRPGHFQGVMKVVKRLFDIVQPQNAYFGEKDFQQLKVISLMTRFFHLSTSIIPCKTLREADGLAMSSRNIRLNPDERVKAAMIPATLFELKKYALCPAEPLNKILEKLSLHLNSIEGIRLEYLNVIDEDSFENISSWESGSKKRAIIAAFVGKVRLIDNIEL